MQGEKAAIVCPACKGASILKRTAQYDAGFKKVGETLSCAACGHVFADEAAVPFKNRPKPSIFDESDRLRAVHVFGDDEKRKACRYCKQYLVNPFTQRCSLHRKTVEAIDQCAQFEDSGRE